MQVGVIIGNQFPESGGGYTFHSEVLNSLVKYQAESNHTFVLYSWDKEQPKEISSDNSIQLISLNRDFKERLNSKLSRTAFAVLRKLRHPRSTFKIEGWYEKYILKSLLEYGIDITWSLLPGCLTMEIPYITTVWDLQHHLQPYFPEVSTEGQWDKREYSYTKILKRASFIIAGTKEGKNEIERFYRIPAERIKVLGFPTPQFALNTASSNSEQILDKYNIQGNYLFYPAQFWPHKNHVNLLLSVKYLREKYGLVFSVVFVGSDKGNESYVRKVVDELNLSKQVHFIGFVSQDDLVLLYRNAFALTFLSFFGPDNLPPLEAFALGCPVVASQVSGAKEQLGDAALFVDPRNPEQIASAIKSLWDDMDLRQRIVKRGFARASKWSGYDYVKKVFSILDEFEAIRRCWSSTERYHQI